MFVHFQGRREAKPLAGVFIDVHDGEIQILCGDRAFEVLALRDLRRGAVAGFGLVFGKQDSKRGGKRVLEPMIEPAFWAVARAYFFVGFGKKSTIGHSLLEFHARIATPPTPVRFQPRPLLLKNP